MVNIIKEEIEIEESLESKLRVICDFCNTTPTIINGSIRKIDKTNLTYIEPYRKSMHKDNPDDIFIDMYMDLINDNSNDINIRLEKIKKFYNYSTRNINLQGDYRVEIKSHNDKKIKNLI